LEAKWPGSVGYILSLGLSGYAAQHRPHRPVLNAV
jgi:hypothetical protein